MKPCGTLSAYTRHLRNKEKPCDPCKKANAIKQKEYYIKNSSKIYNINRKWANKNPDKVRSYSRRITSKRKALKLLNGQSDYTEDQVIIKYGSICYICNKEIDLLSKRQSNGDGWQMGLHIDHLIPLSKGGPDTLENVRPTHAICNLRKGHSGPSKKDEALRGVS